MQNIRSIGKSGIVYLLLCLVTSAQVSASDGSRAATDTSGWQPPAMPAPTSYGPVNISPEKAQQLAEDWGVEVLGLRLTAANMMMDFRFRVIDAEKALPLFDHRIKPYVVVDRSDIKLPVPMGAKVGSFRPTNRGKNITSGRNYYMIFGNPDRHVQEGETVTVVIGDFKVEGLVVN